MAKGKKIALGLLVVLIIIQLIRSRRNENPETGNDLQAVYQVLDDIEKILKLACNDCHSIQLPVANPL